MIIGEDGRPTNEMKLDDGSVLVGSYDLVPCFRISSTNTLISLIKAPKP